MKSFLLSVLFLTFAASASAQVSQQPVDAIVPVVGSTAGAFGARFRTELQLHNPGGTRATGWLILRPQGEGSTTVRQYDLAPHTTLSFADIVEDMGRAGLGSLDLMAERGDVPIAVARAYDDQDGRTTGVNVPLVTAGEVLTSGSETALIAPRDRTRYRFNIGVRTLDNGARLQLTVRNAAGAQRHTRTLTLARNYFDQQPADQFTGVVLQADDSIEIAVTAGSVIVYGTTVDNATNDSSLQLPRRR